MSETIIETTIETSEIHAVVTTPVQEIIANIAVVGERGPAGNGSVLVHEQTAESAEWRIVHDFGRRPAITLYDENGDQMDADVHSTRTFTTVTFPEPTSGFAILN